MSAARHEDVRFTAAAQRMVLGADALARAERSGYLGTEHVAEALFGEGAAAALLEALGARRPVRPGRAPAPPPTPNSTAAMPATSRALVVSPRARAALDAAAAIATAHSEPAAGTVHVLLAVLQDATSAGCAFFASVGVTFERARTQARLPWVLAAVAAEAVTKADRAPATLDEVLDLRAHGVIRGTLPQP